MNTLKEIKREPRNKDAIELLEAVLEQVRNEENATEVFMLVKIDDDYHRFATRLEDMSRLLGVLEISKYDTLRRMTD
jgi:excinuclease UvrABC nuclease subunit